MKRTLFSSTEMTPGIFGLAVIGAIAVVMGVALLFAPLVLYSLHWWTS